DSRITLNSGSGILSNHGIIAPGNSIGTLTVDGDVVFENGSTFEVEIDNAGNSDKLDVSGDVTINGGSTLTINSNGETITNNKQYTLIEANGSITGTFDTVDTALVSWDTGVTGSMSYSGSTALLVVGTPSVTPFNDLSLFQTDNQRACGQAIEQISDAGGNLNGITVALQGIVSDDNLRHTYDQLSGQTRPSIAPIADAAVSGFANTVLGRIHNPQTATSNQYYPDSKYYFWITGFGVNGERDGNEGVNGSDHNSGGVATGLDHQITENFRVGITLGWSDTDVEYDNTRDNSNIDSIYSGLYASYEYINGYIDGIFIYADLDSETKRYVDFIGEKNEGNFDGYEILTSVEAARNYTLKDILVQPLLGFKISYQHQDSYTEKGGSSSLHYDDQS
ncbi:MAG: autotransporter domain-containing protein, partial [Desulfuromusa sp.]|nr:autotransporter domain-containing protein [Desulfuromusa sp.]